MRCVLIELNHKNIKYTKTESCSSITYALSSSPSSHFVRFLYFFTLVITSTSVCVTLKKLFFYEMKKQHVKASLPVHCILLLNSFFHSNVLLFFLLFMLFLWCGIISTLVRTQQFTQLSVVVVGGGRRPWK